MITLEHVADPTLAAFEGTIIIGAITRSMNERKIPTARITLARIERRHLLARAHKLEAVR